MTATDILGGVPGQRVEDIRVEVLDQDGNLTATTTPSAAGTVSFDPTNRITRQWSGVEFHPTEAASLTAGVHRLRPVFVLATGDEYSLGVFLYLGGDEQERPGGTWVRASTMPDRSYQLDKSLSDDYGVTYGGLLTDVIDDMTAASGLTASTITASTATCATYPAWAAGDSKRLEICDWATDLLGYLPVHFDAAGSLIARPIPVPSDEWPDHVYEPGQNAVVHADTVVTTSNVARRPNVYLVRSTAPTGTQVSGRYDVPTDQPNSVATIGYEDPIRFNIDGLATDADCDLVAFRLAQRHQRVVRTVTFDAMPDPRHDAWGIVEWSGERMLEVAWSLDLTPGGPHRHTIQTVYEA